MRKKITLILFVGFILLPVSLFAAGRKEDTEARKVEDKTVQIRVNQFQQELTEIIPQLAEEYSEANPGIEVMIQRAGGENYFDVLKTLAASNDMDDVFGLFAWSFIKDYAEAGFCMDLTGQPILDKVLPSFLPAVTYNNKVYALPFNYQSMGVLYNKEIFAKYNLEVPETISQMESVIKTLKNNDILPFVVAYKDAWTLRQLFSIGHAPTVDVSKFIQNMNNGTEKNFYNSKMDAVFDMFDLMDANCQEKPFDADFITASTKFAMGEAAMFIQGNWVVSVVTQVNPDMNHGMFPMPISNNAGDVKLSVDVGQTLAVYSESEVQHEAVAFLDWLSEPAQANRIANAVAFMLPFKGVDIPDSLGGTGKDIANYIKANQTCPWEYVMWPSGFDGDVEQAMQVYFQNHDRKKFFDTIDKAYQDYR